MESFSPWWFLAMTISQGVEGLPQSGKPSMKIFRLFFRSIEKGMEEKKRQNISCTVFLLLCGVASHKTEMVQIGTHKEKIQC